ncbi:MAG: LamG-like jellyroll fold domain-containing protein [Clostridia bacterium]
MKQKILKEKRKSRTKAKSIKVVILSALFLFLFFTISTTSASWYNPLTWFESSGREEIQDEISNLGQIQIKEDLKLKHDDPLIDSYKDGGYICTKEKDVYEKEKDKKDKEPKVKEKIKNKDKTEKDYDCYLIDDKYKDKEIHIGSTSDVWEISTFISYLTDIGSINITLTDEDVPAEVSNLTIIENENNLKFGAIQNAMEDGELHNFSYLVESDVKLYENGIKTYVLTGNSICSNTIPNYCLPETHEIDFSDVCSRVFEVDEKNISANCEFNYIDENNLEVIFISDKDIDPTIELSNAEVYTDASLTNVSIQANYSHLATNDNNLLLYYSFDGEKENTKTASVYDLTSQGYDGSKVGDAVSNSTCGKYGNGMCFDGTDDTVTFDVADSSSLDMGSSNFTMSFWALSRASNGEGSQYVAQFGTGDYIRILYSDFSNDISVLGAFGDSFTINSGLDLRDGEWHFITVTRLSATDVCLWVDGENLICDGASASIFDSDGTSYIGRAGGLNEFDGMIDEFMIFNESLSESEINLIYNETAPRFKPTGTQEINEINVSDTGNEDKVNITLRDCQTNLETNLSVQVGTQDGSAYSYGTEVYFEDCIANELEISQNPDNISVRINYYTNGTNKFYTPYLIGNMTLESYEAGGEPEEDTTSPTYSNNQTNNTVAGESTKFSLYWNDETALESAGQYIFSTNNTGSWVNDSAINFTSTPQWANVTKTLNSTEDLSIGYRWYATDNAGNMNASEIFVVVTTSGADSENPQWDTIPNNASIEYGVHWSGVDFDASDNVEIDTYFVNDTTNFIINNTGYLNWTNQLAVGNYYVNVSVNDSSGNINSTIYNLNITQNTSACDILFSETSPLTYGDSFNVYTNCGSDFNLYRNGTEISNNSEQSLGADTYNFSVIRTDDSNYSNTYDEEYFVINKAVLTGSITGTTPITYGTTGDVEGSESNSGDGDVDYKLYRDGVEVSNPDAVVLGAGTYNYVYNSTGGANYSANDSIDSFELVVNQATGGVELELDGTRASETVEVNTEVSIEGNLINGTFGTLNLTIDGEEVNSSSTTNLTYTFQETGIGDYVVNLSYNGNENYTADWESWTITYEDTSAPSVTIIYPETDEWYATNTLDLNYTASDDNGDKCWYSKNNGVTNSSPVSFGTNFTEVIGTEGSNTWIVYCNDSSGNEGSDSVAFNIDTTPPYFTSLVNQTIAETNSLDYTPTADDDGIGLANWSINDTSLVTINGITGQITNVSALTEGYYVYNISINDSLGNTNSSLWALNVTAVDNTNPSVSTTIYSIDNGNEYNPSNQYQFNSTITDDTSLDAILFEFDGVNYSVNNNGDEYYYDAGNLAVGDYVYRWYVNDSSGNRNDTETGTYSVVQNSSYILDIDLSPLDSETYGTETTATGLGCPSQLTCDFYINDSSVSNPHIESLGAGSWNYTYNTSGNANYSAKSYSDLLTINKATPTLNYYLNDVTDNISIVYPNTINTSANTNAGTLAIYRNGTDITSDNNIDVQLGAGYYEYEFNVTGNENYTDVSSVYLYAEVNQSESDCQVLFNETSPITYPNSFLVWSDCDSAFTLYRNGTEISNNSVQQLGASSYNFTAIREDTTNYTNTYDEETFVVDKATPSLSLNFEPSNNEDYGTETNVSGLDCPSEVTCNLYRNDSAVSNPDVQTLEAGSYNYTFNTTGNDNYTSDSVSGILTINAVIDNPPTFDNLRNFTHTVNTSFSKSITASDDGSISDYNLNDTSVFNISNVGLITNVSALDTLTTYWLNITATDDGGQNVTGMFYINVTAGTTTTTGNLCRYRKFGYYNTDLSWYKEVDCI